MNGRLGMKRSGRLGMVSVLAGTSWWGVLRGSVSTGKARVVVRAMIMAEAKVVKRIVDIGAEVFLLGG